MEIMGGKSGDGKNRRRKEVVMKRIGGEKK